MKVLHILTDAVLAPQHLLYWPQTKTGKQMIAIFKRYNGSFTSAYYSSHREMHLNLHKINLDSVFSIHLSMGDRGTSMAVLVDSDINDDDLIYVCMIVDSDYDDKIVLYNRHEQLTEYIINNCEDIVDITVLSQTYTKNQVFDSTSE